MAESVDDGQAKSNEASEEGRQSPPSTADAYIRSARLKPLEPDECTWSATTFAAFWILGNCNVSNWTTASSLLSLGLSVWQAMLVIGISQILVVPVAVSLGTIGAKERLSFPVMVRSPFGIFGAILPIILRFFLSVMWSRLAQCAKFLGLEEWTAGFCGTNDLVAFLLFNLITVPLMLLDPKYVTKPFRYGSFAIVAAIFSLLVWALAREHGGGPLLTRSQELIGVSRPASLAWTMLYGMNSYLGAIVGLVVQIANTTRFARKPGDQIIGQAVVLPVTDLLVAIISILVTSCAADFYPTEPLLWTPFALLSAIQRHSSPAARAPVFFAACSFVIGQLGINVLGNTYQGGVTLSSLLPRYFTPLRGGAVVAVLGVCTCPWFWLNESDKVLKALSSFAIVFGPLCAIMLADYHIVQKGAYDKQSLFQRNSKYYYTGGFNICAFIAWVMVIWPALPGFVDATNGKDGSGWMRYYTVSGIAGFLLSALLFVALEKAQSEFRKTPKITQDEKHAEKDTSALQSDAI